MKIKRKIRKLIYIIIKIYMKMSSDTNVLIKHIVNTALSLYVTKQNITFRNKSPPRFFYNLQCL